MRTRRSHKVVFGVGAVCMALAIGASSQQGVPGEQVPRVSAPTASAGKVLMPKRVKMILEFRNRAIA